MVGVKEMRHEAWPFNPPFLLCENLIPLSLTVAFVRSLSYAPSPSPSLFHLKLPKPDPFSLCPRKPDNTHLAELPRWASHTSPRRIESSSCNCRNFPPHNPRRSWRCISWPAQ